MLEYDLYTYMYIATTCKTSITAHTRGDTQQRQAGNVISECYASLTFEQEEKPGTNPHIDLNF